MEVPLAYVVVSTVIVHSRHTDREPTVKWSHPNRLLSGQPLDGSDEEEETSFHLPGPLLFLLEN